MFLLIVRRFRDFCVTRIASIVSSIRLHFFSFLVLQLFLILISLPILLAWGLPFSIMSPVGNLVFAPFLTVFLFIASLLFFTELAAIPNEWLVWLLDYITGAWQWCMNWGTGAWLYALPEPAWWICCAMPVGTCAIMSYRFFRSDGARASVLLMALALCCLVLHGMQPRRPTITQIACNDLPVTIINTGNKTIVVDTGALGRTASTGSWCRYSLLSEVMKRTGRTTIDCLVSLQPTTFTFEAFTALHGRTTIVQTYLPRWRGMISKGAWRAFKALEDEIARRGRTLIRVAPDASYDLFSSRADSCLLEPIGSTLQYHDAQYPVVRLLYAFDNEQVAFYPAKYANKKGLKKKRESHGGQKGVTGCCA